MAPNRNEGWVYVLDTGLHLIPDSEARIYKIGRTVNLTQRIKQLRIAFPHKLTVAYAFFSQNQFTAEAELHELFAEKRMNGEWFTLDYADLSLISDYADNSGYIEAASGTLICDPFIAYNEQEAINAAHRELDADLALALKAKYLPLARTTGTSNDCWEADEDGLLEEYHLANYDHDEREAREQEEYEEYLRQCDEEAESERQRRQEITESDDEEEGDWDHEYTEPGDEKLIAQIEQLMRSNYGPEVRYL